MNEKATMASVEDTIAYTVDCTDPAFAKNANCLVYSDQVSNKEVVST